MGKNDKDNFHRNYILICTYCERAIPRFSQKKEGKFWTN
jgi:hypothetical protein